MVANVEMVHEYFRQYGWTYDFDDASRTWVTGFRGDSNNFNVFVHLTENWIYFIISPLVEIERNPVCEQRLYHHMLRLNHVVNMAKFSLDADGDISLTVELPAENLDYSEFCDALNALSYYADNHYWDIFYLAQDPQYVPMRVSEDEEVWTFDHDGGSRGVGKPN